MGILITILQAAIVLFCIYVVRAILKEPEECRRSPDEIYQERLTDERV